MSKIVSFIGAFPFVKLEGEMIEDSDSGERTT